MQEQASHTMFGDKQDERIVALCRDLVAELERSNAAQLQSARDTVWQLSKDCRDDDNFHQTDMFQRIWSAIRA